MSSRSNARFIPHIGNRVPFGIVRIASTYLISTKKKNHISKIKKRFTKMMKIADM